MSNKSYLTYNDACYYRILSHHIITFSHEINMQILFNIINYPLYVWFSMYNGDDQRQNQIFIPKVQKKQ